MFAKDNPGEVRCREGATTNTRGACAPQIRCSSDEVSSIHPVRDALRFFQLMRRYRARAAFSNQPALAKVADISAGGALDHVNREFEQTNLPAVVDALDDDAERFLHVFDL